jgi:hypothetical protein
MSVSTHLRYPMLDYSKACAPASRNASMYLNGIHFDLAITLKDFIFVVLSIHDFNNQLTHRYIALGLINNKITVLRYYHLTYGVIKYITIIR